MGGDGALVDIVGGIYQAVLEPGGWVGALDRVADHLNVHHAHLFVADSRSQDASFAAVSHRMPSEGLEQYHSHYQSIDPRIQAGWSAPVGLFLPDWRLCDMELFLRGEFYNDFYRHYEARWMIGAVLQREVDVATGFAVVRTLNQGAFDDADMRRLEQLAPHLKRAAAMLGRLTGLDRRRRAEIAALDCLNIGIVLLDAMGRPMFINRSAEDVFALEDGLTVTGEGLRAAIPSVTGSLRRLVDEALAASLGQSSTLSGPIAVLRPSLKRPFEVLVAPLSPMLSAWGIESGGAMVLLSDPDRDAVPPAAWLARLYGLTPAEARVAAALASGKSPRQIVEATETSIHAVRWHLKQIFQKTGTRRQAELVGLLGRGLTVLARPPDDRP